MSGIAQKLADYIVNLRYQNIPSDAVDMARKCVFDSMGNMMCGRYSEMGAKTMDYIKAYSEQTYGEGLVSLLGGGKATKEDTMTAHSIMARCADLDDGHRYAMGHPGSVVIPSALVTGELKDSTGEEILTAIVAGYDVYCRIGAAINPTSYRERGFDATGICGAVACAATIGKLYGLDTLQMKNALGIASLFAGGLIEYQNDGTMGKVICGCWAAHNGMKSVQMAQQGFTGPDQAFEGSKGFFQAFSNAPDSTKVLKNLGTDFKIKETYFKMHACMRGLHAAVDALLDIRTRENLTDLDVTGIEVYTTPFVGRLSNPHPTTPIGAQCSLEFVLAVAMSHGHISQENLLTDALRVESNFEAASHVKLIIDDKVDAYVKQNPSHWAAVNIVIYTKDGRRLKQWSALPRGEAESPFDWNQLAEKFERLLGETPYQPYSKKMYEQIRHFESINNWSDIYTPWTKTNGNEGVVPC